MIPGYDEWKTNLPEEPESVMVKEKLNGSGYAATDSGTFVPEEDAFLYALERVSNGTEEEKQEFVDWFYSGNWVKEE